MLSSSNGQECQVLGFGDGSNGQLGTIVQDMQDNILYVPTCLPDVIKLAPLRQIACGARHTLAVTSGGEVYSWGSNEFGQLGRKDLKRAQPQPLPSLQTFLVVSVSCGEDFSMCLTETGKILSWGGNDYGQLGHGDREPKDRPRPIRMMATSTHDNKSIVSMDDRFFIDIVCGANFALAITQAREVFSWGNNSDGQLGNGEFISQSYPVLNETFSKRMIPVETISCGERHCAALTVSGNVYVWGCNTQGQLGLGDTRTRLRPELIRNLRRRGVKQISCGSRHTAVLTTNGVLLTCGANNFGQLGQGVDQASESSMRAVVDLPGKVLRVACGNRHTIITVEINHEAESAMAWESNDGQEQALITPIIEQRLYCCGSVRGGLLGLGKQIKSDSMEIDDNLFLKRLLFQRIPGFSYNKSEPLQLCCGIQHTILFLTDSKKNSETFQNFETNPLPLKTADWFKEMTQKGKYTDLRQWIEATFSNPAAFNRCFLNPNHTQCSFGVSGLNYVAIREFYQILALTGKSTNNDNNSSTNLLRLSTLALGRLVEKKYFTSMKLNDLHDLEFEALRCYAILLEHPALWTNTAENSFALQNICTSLMALPQEHKEVLCNWWSQEQITFGVFERVVEVFQRYLSHLIILSTNNGAKGTKSRNMNNGTLPRRSCNGGDTTEIAPTRVLEFLHNFNEKKHVIPAHKFYNEDLSSCLSLEADMEKWLSGSNSVFSYCRYPFLFTCDAKARLLNIYASTQMRQQVGSILRERALLGTSSLPFLILQVRRDHLVEDTLAQVVAYSVGPNAENEWKKPLKVIFVGEEGLDEGGLRKEFFHLITRELFDIRFGMFSLLPDSNKFWFNCCAPLESDPEYRLIGIILGLAIYNGAILDIHFPLVVYKKLLFFAGKKTQHQHPHHSQQETKPTYSLDDLSDSFPQLGNSLQKLLDYPEDDVEDVFGLTFQARFSGCCEGEYTTFDLVSDGGSVNVTNANREKYVQQYIECLLEQSVVRQFEAFATGFLSVADGLISVPNFFRVEELERIICGIDSSWMDFKELENATVYEGYHKNHPVVKNFWEVVHSLSIELKQKLLFFVTGSSRLPLDGFGGLRFVVQRSGPDSDRLPAAHVCFNILDLPEYSSKEKLERLLLLALREAHSGFGLR